MTYRDEEHKGKAWILWNQLNPRTAYKTLEQLPEGGLASMLERTWPQPDDSKPMTVDKIAVMLYNEVDKDGITHMDELSEQVQKFWRQKARDFMGIGTINYDLEADQKKAWELLKVEKLGDYNTWEEVPADIKNEYVSYVLKGKKPDVMGDNEGNVADTLKQRGGIYGSYENVCAVRSSILKNLDVHHKQVNGEFMEPELMVAFGDLVLKLVRAAGAPKYADSFHDLGGYAKLMEDIANEG